MLVTSPGHSSGGSILAAFFGVRYFERKNSWLWGFKTSLDICLFLCLGVGLRTLEKNWNRGMKRSRNKFRFRPFCQGLVLKILNMRNTFAISSLAVIHGGKGAAGLWEVPETTRTILCPGDR